MATGRLTPLKRLTPRQPVQSRTHSQLQSAAVKKPGEMQVVWKLVEQVERLGLNGSNDKHLLDVISKDPQTARNFSNYLRGNPNPKGPATSSMSPYEANKLAEGFGLGPANKAGLIRDSARKDGFTIGDRVTVTYRERDFDPASGKRKIRIVESQGIVLRNRVSDGGMKVLTADPITGGLRVVSPKGGFLPGLEGNSRVSNEVLGGEFKRLVPANLEWGKQGAYSPSEVLAKVSSGEIKPSKTTTYAPLAKAGASAKASTAEKYPHHKYLGVLDRYLTQPAKAPSKLAEVFKKDGPQVGQHLPDDDLKLAQQFGSTLQPVATTQVSPTETVKLFTNDSKRVSIHERIGGYRDVHVTDTSRPGFQLWIYPDKNGRITQRTLDFQQGNLSLKWITHQKSERVITSAVTPSGTAYQIHTNGKLTERGIDGFLGQPLTLPLTPNASPSNKGATAGLLLTPTSVATPRAAADAAQVIATQLGQRVTLEQIDGRTIFEAKPTTTSWLEK